MKDKGNFFFILLPIGVVVLLALVALFGSRGGSVSSDDVLTVQANDHVKGVDSAAVTIMEFKDFQCPGCAGFAPLLSQLQENYPDDVRVVFRHFPLTSIHQNAIASAQAAEAAGMQGKFWEMHDAIFAGQQTWSGVRNPLSIFEGYASDLGLDMEQFAADYESNTVRERIRTDLRGAQSLGLTGTPTFFVNGEKIETPGNYAQFAEIVERAISGDALVVPAPEVQVKTAE